MHRRNVPQEGAPYWLALSAASVFGANLGDTVSHSLHLGHVRGLPLLGLAFALVLAGERRSVRPGQAWYWLAIVILRTAATNLADLATHDLRLDAPEVIAGLGLLLAGLVAAQGRAGRGGPGPRAAGLDGARPGLGGVAQGEVGLGDVGCGLPAADGWFWAAMLVAGTLGTAGGDFVSDGLGLGTGPATLACGAALGAIFVLRRWLGRAAAYWLPVVGIRTAGTTLGDFVVGHGGLGLGLPVGTACTGAVFVLAVVLGRRAWGPGVRQAPPGSPSTRMASIR